MSALVRKLRSEFHCAQVADHQTARPGFCAGLAHFPHHRMPGCKPSRHLGLTARQEESASNRRLSFGVLDWTRCSMAACAKAIGSHSRVVGTGSLSWHPIHRGGHTPGRAGNWCGVEERPQAYASERQSRLDLRRRRRRETHHPLLRPLDLSVDETMHSILDAVRR